MSARILIVEDHADLRHLIRMMLEFDGYEIYEASDASEGLEMVHRVRPHLLVLDIMLPGGMNGLDLCRLLKTNPALGLPAVVLVTARGQPRDIEAGLAAGADAYLVYVASSGSQLGAGPRGRHPVISSRCRAGKRRISTRRLNFSMFVAELFNIIYIVSSSITSADDLGIVIP